MPRFLSPDTCGMWFRLQENEVTVVLRRKKFNPSTDLVRHCREAGVIGARRRNIFGGLEPPRSPFLDPPLGHYTDFVLDIENRCHVLLQ